jgi:outer membrane receptor protein involved in Fe transport
MRGISTAGGQDGNHSGPQPLVGIYFDEQPTTTILGQLDILLYDIQRIEALAGPQGTLFGASSEAGTLRIITNKPDPTKFSGSFDTQFETTRGDFGHVVQGYVNVPLSDRVAIRLVGFEEGDPGYIDNVHATRTYLGAPGIKLDNADMVQDNFNGVQTYGGRAALGINLDDEWTATVQLMGQEQRSTGVFGFNPRVGDLKVTQFSPDNTQDSWAQAALTIQGKIGDFDVTYSGGYFDRGLQTNGDYSDYTAAYTTSYHHYAHNTVNVNFPASFHDNAGNQVDPSQRIVGRDHFTKLTQELRIASPTEDRFRFVAGIFFERQEHKIHQDYKIDGIGTDISVPNFPGTIWLTQQQRVDRDAAVFGQATYDIDDHWSATAGIRVFETRNSLYGFYGFGEGFSSHTGQVTCFIQGNNFADAPCANLDKTVEEVNATFKANLQYKFDPERMVYATVSSGYRPGGVNRRGDLPGYTSDMLYNYEIGWKTTWNNGEIRWNGAMFWENWDDFQFSFLGPNSLTQIANAASATVRGLETDVTWAVTPNFTLSGSGSFINSEITSNVCPDLTLGPKCLAGGKPNFWTLSGTPLPVTPPVAFNITGRYEADLSDTMTGFIQATTVFEGRRTSDLRALTTDPAPTAQGFLLSPRDQIGPMPAYVTFDLSAGITRGDTSASIFFKNLFDSRGEVYRYVECGGACINHPNVYIVTVQPFTFGVKLGQKF